VLFRKQSRQRSLTGVYLGHNGLGIATISHQAGRKAVLEQASWHATGPDSDIPGLLGKQIPSNRQMINLVLADTHYQLLLVEAPRVEPAELRAALRWKIKNLIDFHIDDVVIDVFEIPGQQDRPSGQAMMYVIAASTACSMK